ncbi:MAG TPA: ATP-binding protein [Polyangiaceae bacterium]|nr:ATP-binding protein [Polyangiaceae bacterium]
MTLRGPDSELSARWSEWLLWRNRRGMRAMLCIVPCLCPAFAVLDALTAPARGLPWLHGTLAALTLVSLVLLPAVSSRWFRRHPHAISAGYTILSSLGISSTTLFMGGLASPHYAGLSLIMVASGLLFVWPRRVVVATYAASVLGFLLPNLLLHGVPDVLTAAQNQFFLISTALIAGAGQLLAHRSQREQLSAELAREEAARQVESAHERLEQLDRFKSEFFANITHELKTPLTLILAPLGLMLDGQLGAVSDEQRSTLAAMQRSGVKLSRLIGDLLDLSKLEESRLRLRVEQHDLVAHLDGLIRQIEPLAERKRLRLSFQADVARVDVWCDIERLERVFLNLLSNATKFTLVGGSIQVRLCDEGGAVRVDVSDDGVGFPSELRDEVFRRFVQADMPSTRRFGGAGLGLALAKELVELHGGRIWARSAPGEGATFSVRLLADREHFSSDVLDRRRAGSERPGGQRESDHSLSDWDIDIPDHLRFIDIDEATEQRRLEPDADEHRRERSVLVVEDTPDVARVLRATLHREYKVLVAVDGEQGLELARRQRPSVIISDWMMPKLDGLELTRALRRDAQTRHIPIVMLTARADLDDRVRALEAGVSAFVVKPFASSEIVSTLRALQRSQDAAADSLLSQKMDSLETIAGGLAHEILNPLNYLANALTIAQNDSESLALAVKNAGGAPPESGIVRRIDRMQEMFEVSRAGVQRIAGTVDLMVRYSREGYARRPSSYDAYAAVRDVVAVLGPSLARSTPIRLELVGDGWIDCVAEEFNQVLSNLVQNALEAAPKDGSGRVVIAGRNEGGELYLAVRDNGPGIPESERARIFDAFYTTKQAGHGMGLGLTITRRVVVALGGSVELESALGKGSTFIIRVPSSIGCREAAS